MKRSISKIQLHLFGLTFLAALLVALDGKAAVSPVAPLAPDASCGIMTKNEVDNYSLSQYWMESGGANHNAVDLALTPAGTGVASPCTLGKPVAAICEGQVVSFNPIAVADQAVIVIDHPNCNGKAIRAYYGNLAISSNMRQVGKEVAQGDVLGTIMPYPNNLNHLSLTLDTNYRSRSLNVPRYEMCGFTSTTEGITGLSNCKPSKKSATPRKNQVLLEIGWGRVTAKKIKSGSAPVKTTKVYLVRKAMNDLGFISYFDFVLPAPTPPSLGFPLNDTGITRCASERLNGLACPVSGYPWQDAEFGRDVTQNNSNDGHAGFSFVKLDASGNALPSGATVWSCVRDKYTGLVWEEKTATGLRGLSNTYSWYDPDSRTNGGNAGRPNGGSCSGSGCDTHAYVQTVNGAVLCGARDWRLPTVDELLSIVRNDLYSPAIDKAFFRNTPAAPWSWSVSSNVGNAGSAWYVSFGFGHVNDAAKSNANFVRLVRSGQ